MSRFSVIIPLLNEQEFIGHAIESALDAGADEVIAVDGGSQDQSLDIVHSRNCRVLSVSPPGRGRQLNAGADAATGDILVFLHADCELSKNCLDDIRLAIAADELAWGCFSQSIQTSGRRFRWLERGNAWRARYRGLVYGDQGFWVSRNLYRQSGGFPNLPLLEDVVLSRRLRSFRRPQVLPGPVRISPRGWQQRGVAGQTLFNWACYGLFRCGVSPDWIANRYRRQP